MKLLKELSQAKTQPLRSLYVSIFEGCFAFTHISILQSSIITALALHFNARDIHLALIQAFTALSTIGAIIGAYIIGRMGKRKPVVTYGSMIGRGSIVILAFLPFLNISNESKLIIFLSVIFFGGIIINSAVIGWLSWIKDLTPDSIMGKYLGLRFGILGLAGTLIYLGAGFTFDFFKSKNLTEWGFFSIFTFAFIGASISGYLLTTHHEEPSEDEVKISFREIIFRPFQDKHFTRFIGFASLWGAIIGFALPFWVPFMLEHLKMNYTTISIWFIIFGIFSLLSQPVWGKALDKFGAKPVIKLSCLVLAFIPIFWLLATPNFYLPIWLDGIVSGIFMPAVVLATYSLQLRLAPSKNRSAFIAITTTITGIVTFLASLVSGILAEYLSKKVFAIGSLSIVNYQIVFICAGVFRLLLLPYVYNLDEKHSHKMRHMLIFTLERGFIYMSKFKKSKH